MSQLGIQCVVAAGGRGTRLRPLTDDLPKPMVAVLGVPFLHWLIARLMSKGIERFLILTGYRGDKIVEYFGDGRRLGCSILYSHEDRPLGSGGALWAAQEFLDDEFLHVNGDDYPDIDYEGLVEDFRERSVLAMVAACKASDGRLEVDDETGCVTSYSGPSHTAYLDCGTKIFRREVLDLVRVCPPFALEPTLWPILIVRQQLQVLRVSSRPHAIDIPRSLRDFEDWLRQQGVPLPVPVGKC